MIPKHFGLQNKILKNFHQENVQSVYQRFEEAFQGPKFESPKILNSPQENLKFETKNEVNFRSLDVIFQKFIMWSYLTYFFIFF